MIIFRYICKELYINMLAITLVLLIIFITNQFIHYLNDAANGRLTMASVMKIMGLQIPLLLGYLLPLAFFLSVLLGMGRLYMNHEITVMSACGISDAKIFSYIMIFAVLLMGFVAWLMLWFEPIIQGYRTEAINESVRVASVERIIPSQFRSFGNMVFYAKDADRINDKMWDVFFAQHTQPQHTSQKVSWDITVAERAEEKNSPYGYGKYIIFQDGYRDIGVPGQKNFQLIKFKNYGVKLMQSKFAHSDWPNSVPTLLLWKEAKKNKLAASLMQWRLAVPISVLLLALLGFSLCQVNPRQGKFSRLVPAIVIYIGYTNLIFLGRAWLKKGIIPIAWGMWWLHGAVLLFALLLLAWRFKWYHFLQRKRHEIKYASA